MEIYEKAVKRQDFGWAVRGVAGHAAAGAPACRNLANVGNVGRSAS